jgi:hypothetical protein
MAGDGEHRQPAGQPTGIRAERTAEESARPAWVKPAVHRFSLQKTLAGSGVGPDATAQTGAFHRGTGP